MVITLHTELLVKWTFDIILTALEQKCVLYLVKSLQLEGHNFERIQEKNLS